jgi:hypothetical protein
MTSLTHRATALASRTPNPDPQKSEQLPLVVIVGIAAGAAVVLAAVVAVIVCARRGRAESTVSSANHKSLDWPREGDNDGDLTQESTFAEPATLGDRFTSVSRTDDGLDRAAEADEFL